MSPAPQPLQRRPVRSKAGIPIRGFNLSTSLARPVLIIQGQPITLAVTGPDIARPSSVYWTTTRRSPMPRSTPILGVLLLASLLTNVLLAVRLSREPEKAELSRV